MTLNESIVEDAALEWFGELVPRLREEFVWRGGAGGSLARGHSVTETGHCYTKAFSLAAIGAILVFFLSQCS